MDSPTNEGADADAGIPLMATDGDSGVDDALSKDDELEEVEEVNVTVVANATETGTGDADAALGDDPMAADAGEAVVEVPAPQRASDDGDNDDYNNDNDDDDDDQEEGEVLDDEERKVGPKLDAVASEADVAVESAAEPMTSDIENLDSQTETEAVDDVVVRSEVEPTDDHASDLGETKVESEEVTTKEEKVDTEDDMAEDEHEVERDEEKDGDSDAMPDATKVEEPSSEEFHEEVDAMEVDATEEPKADDASVEVGTSVETGTSAPEAAVENGSSTADESSFKELPYSTRGRSTTGSVLGEEKSDRVAAKEILEDMIRPKDAPAGVSFLESLSEEERRTRTRFLPDVDGMHTLRKHEVKEDMALARSLPSIATSSGSIQSRAVRLAASTGRKKDAMSVDGEESDLALYDVRAITIQLASSEVTVPSDSFVAPDGVIMGETEGTIALKESTKKDNAIQSPSLVESVTAFNPPRPPESVGAKKKHRVLRWERRPEDIEVDMKNYRRTVQRTRQELRKSEAEYERLETIDAHLRRHFLSHLELLNEEYRRLHDAMQVEVQNLMNETDLGVSRTRSKNLTKVSVVMRDVLTGLSKNEWNGTGAIGENKVGKQPPSAECLPGIGGLNAQAFLDWDRSTDIRRLEPAISWVQVGQKVATPYGEGTVKTVIAPEMPQTSSLTDKEKTTDGESPKHGTNEEGRGDFQRTSNREKGGMKLDLIKDDAKSSLLKEQSKYSTLLPAQVEVNLELGVATFPIDAIKSVEGQAHLTDAELRRRWKEMIESALQVGPSIDVQGMSSMPENSSEVGEDGSKDASLMMDIDAEAKVNRSGLGSENDVAEETFLPVGSSLFPTKGGRGNYLYSMPLPDIEKELHAALYNGHGVLGKKTNPGVTKIVRKWEDDEHEYYSLRASVLQLKNALYRHRRIRVLNERTSISMTDRYQRAEELVSEMRSDLKSLKRRLEDELTELGITEEMAGSILSKFYKGYDEEDKGDASTPKRLRRASTMNREALSGSGGGANFRDEDSRDSDDQGTDDLSGDDNEVVPRPSKKSRTGQ